MQETADIHLLSDVLSFLSKDAMAGVPTATLAQEMILKMATMC